MAFLLPPKAFIILILLFFTGLLQAQNYTISGTAKDAKTGETIIGAAITVKDKPGTGTTSNAFGFYSLTLPAGDYTLLYMETGYATQSVPIHLNKSQRIDIKFSEDTVTLKEVVVHGEQANQNVTSADVSKVKLDIKELNKVPVIFGEKDIMKTIQLLPGIMPVSDGNSGFYVRGGTADQNLVLLDGATVYNPSHLLGFFSVFNSDAIKDVTVYKGAPPAEYGGRISSVIDVKMNDGNNQNYIVSGGIGLIASRIALEGPIRKNKGSFLITARRTYADLFLKLSNNATDRNTSLYFYDLNFKGNYELSQKDHVYLSGYFGRDVFNYSTIFGFNWGNSTATARWNHLFNDKLFLNSSLIFTNYNYVVNIGGVGTGSLGIQSSIQDFSWKEDFTWFASTSHTVSYGFNSTFHTFVPGGITVGGVASSAINNLTLQNEYALENALYIGDEYEISGRVRMNYGLRYSTFSRIGPGTLYSYTQSGAVEDSTKYTSLSFMKTYGGLEPRVNVTYQLDDQSSIKASYARNRQYLQMLSNSTTTTPIDLWIPASNNIKPQIGDQVSTGYFRNFLNNMFETSVEVYYKYMQNQIDYRPGAELEFNKFVESQVVQGTAQAYGIEFYLKKKVGKYTGWISYTLSHVTMKDSTSKAFPATQDRPNNLSIVGMYDPNPKWSFSAVFVFLSGNAVTFPSGQYTVDGITSIPYYTSRNGYRMPPYNRLDLSATVITKKTAKREGSWNFSLYNAYGRENPYIIQFQANPNVPNTNEALQISLFRWVPSITYNFKF